MSQVTQRTPQLSAERLTILSRFFSVSRFDICAYILILALCALPFFFYQRAPDFINSDAHYVDLAYSLRHDHSYSANFTYEGLVPPGFAVILVALCATIGCTHDILTPTMSVFLALGFLLSYQVLRRQLGRGVAAVSCLLLAASPSIFPWVTTRLWPIFAYFFVSMAVLLLIPKLNDSKTAGRTVSLMILLTLLLVSAVMIEGIGLSLTIALSGWLLFSFLSRSELAARRLKRFLPIVLIALSLQGLWLHQNGNRREWPIHGMPEGYLEQLKVKDGNYPELGLATPKDIVLRVEKNLKDSSVFLGTALFHEWIDPAWFAIPTSGFVILIFCGLYSSLARDETRPSALYFIFFECVYLLWPWFSGVVRFAIAVLPLACLYLAEGAVYIRRLSRNQPRRCGALFLPVSFFLASLAVRAATQPGVHHGFQERFSLLFWIAGGILSLYMVWKGSLPSFHRSPFIDQFLSKLIPVGFLVRVSVQLTAGLVVACFVFSGVAAEIPMARQNLVSGREFFATSAEIEAARWINEHAPPNAVIAAGQNALIFHYSRRMVVWFPPISDPQVVMEGLYRNRIQHIVIIERKFSYYLPPETQCFGLLYAAHPADFRLEMQDGPLRIYEFLPNTDTLPLAPGQVTHR